MMKCKKQCQINAFAVSPDWRWYFTTTNEYWQREMGTPKLKANNSKDWPGSILFFFGIKAACFVEHKSSVGR